MLKALEVQGFKSFADRTRFEFPPGITVIVGPNGSGKSNVVDAIKWVLGEQSAKSLRGKDMADVIFKGSGSAASGRKAMNFAEATIIFDNADQKLPVDATEVHVTRRVYRSGEGEYLINGNPCRLKDIKDLFRGTGVSVDAYSIIEQGKVDRMLQASPRDRRAMFEEAAGISRFKAKKVEAQRRLERVDQNLLRLRDIVEEVDARLKNVRSQAAKAQRYRESSERLKVLRTFTAWTDWQALSARQQQLQSDLDGLRSQLEERIAESEGAEECIRQWDASLNSARDELRSVEGRLSQNREQTTARDAACELERGRIRDLEEELARRRQQFVAMSSRVVDVRTRLRDVDAQLSAAQAGRVTVADQLKLHETRLAEVDALQKQVQRQIESLRRDYVAHMREAAEIGTRASALASQQERSREQLAASEQEAAAVAASLATSQEDLQRLETAAAEQAATVEGHAEALEAAQLELNQNRLLLSERHDDLSHLRGRQRGAEHRLELLQDLESRREGLEAGVKDLLDSARLRNELAMRGLVADCISAPPEFAQLIDLALGERSQAVVLAGGLDRLATQPVSTKGQVAFIGLSDLSASSPANLSGKPGVVARADELATALPGFEALLSPLLGHIWIVETLADALRLRSEGATHVRFVARSGERLETDGTVVVGASRGVAGLISRRAELRTLRLDLAVFQRQIDEAEREAAQIRENISVQEAAVRRLTDDHRRAASELADRQVAVRSHRQQTEQWLARAERLSDQKSELSRLLGDAEAEIKELRAARQTLEQSIAHSESSIAAAEQEIREHESQKASLQQAANTARMELARAEQRVDALQLQRFQCEQDERERDRLLAEVATQLDDAAVRRETAERNILAASAEMAELFLARETLLAARQLHTSTLEQLSADKARVAEQAYDLRRTVKKLEEQVHALEIAAGNHRHELEAVASRMREDYGIELAALTEPPAGDERPREQIEEEIAALRKKVNSVGAVNLDSLEELDELETRYQHLSAQYDDLSQAKASLERIIHKINADSRRIFTETLEAIRTNFQALYRRAFGGGKADLALEEGADVLEAGVDILATPPGKPSFNNSLLSGGEKALTAVALLLAIFQFRPSPFCVLDEVDAPFDEANIGRFVDVLRDFLGWTRFIIVTHSKKTMTAANTLYGVTMQESGISKRVSVRFDDVSEDGRISREAVEREAALEVDQAKGVA
jgi:chromosome segregation protein